MALYESPEEKRLREEEERKRKQKLGVGGAVAAETPLPVKTATKPGTIGVGAGVGWNSPTTDYLKRALDVTKQTQAKEQQPSLTEFWTLAKKMGQPALGQRISQIEGMWGSYMKGISGKAAVWQLVKSPYSIDEIEVMLRAGNLSVFGVPVGDQQMAVGDQFMRERGYAKPTWGVGLEAAIEYSRPKKSWLERAGDWMLGHGFSEGTSMGEGGPAYLTEEQSLADVEARKTMLPFWLTAASFMVPGAGALGVTSLAGRTGLSAAINLPRAYAMMEGAGAVLGEVEKVKSERLQEKLANKSLLTGMAQAAMEGGYLQPESNIWLEGTSPVYKEYADLQRVLPELDKEDMEGLQEWFSKNGVYDDDGEFHPYLIEGTYKKGELDWITQNAITDYYQEVIRSNTDQQRILIETGFAPLDAEINGDMGSGGWPQYQAKYAEDWERKLQLGYEHPQIAAFLETAGIPVTRAGLDAMMRRMTHEGIPYILFGGWGIEAAKLSGQLWQAGGSALNLSARLANDDEYDAKKQALIDYVMTQPFAKVPGSPDAYDAKPEEGSMAYAMYQLQHGNLKEDEEAQRLYSDVQAHVSTRISERYSPDYILSIAHALGIPYDSVQKFADEHPDAVHATTVAIDLGLALANPVGKFRKVALQRRVAGNAEAFIRSGRAQKVSDFAADLAWTGDWGKAARYIKGRGVQSLLSGVKKWKRRANPDEATFKAEFKRRSAQAYANSDVYPYFRLSGDRAPRRARYYYEDLIERVNSDKARWLLAKWTYIPFTHAPLSKVDYHGVGSIDRMFESALSVSGDVRWANFIAEKFALAKTPAQFKRIDDLMQAKKTQVFGGVADTSRFIQGLQSWSERATATIAGALGVQQVGTALSPHPTTGVPTGTFFSTRDKILKQTVPGPVYEQYAIPGFRSSLWTPYKISAGNWEWRAYLHAANVGRKFSWIASTGSRPLRQLTVAAGAPLLFQKHAITDTFRNFMDGGPVPLMLGIGHEGRWIKFKSSLSKRWEKLLDEVDPEVAAQIRTDEHTAHVSEMQYTSGSRTTKWTVAKLRKNGKVRDINEAGEVLRRIAQDPAYRSYAQGGEAAVRAWLATPEGKNFLHAGGHTEMARELAVLQGKPKPTNKELYDLAVENFVQDQVISRWKIWDDQLPGIMAEVKSMSTGHKPLNVAELKKAIDDNPTEDGFFSRELKSTSPTDAAGYIVGKAMTMNKWNRGVIYKYTFTKVYKQLRKEGMEPNAAALSASSAAFAKTARIQFDLGNALHMEAKHRWFAWFATKHRLYGTYVGKLALERPMIAGAAYEIRDWMEERNADKSVSDFDKYDLAFTVPDWVPGLGGTQASINLAPYMWLAEYPLESSLGHWIESQGTDVVNTFAGTNLVDPSPNPFGYSTGRWDAFIKTLSYAVKSPYQWWKGPKAAEYTDEDISKYLASLGEEEERKLNKAINMKRAEALAMGREITVKEAFEQAIRGALYYEAFMMCKPLSGKFDSPQNIAVNQLLKEYFDTSQKDPEAAYGLLENDALAAALNATMDPVKKAQLDEGFRERRRIEEETNAKIDAAWEKGTLVEATARIVAWRERELADLTENEFSDTYNPTYAEWVGAHEPEGIREALGLLLPLVDTEDLIRQAIPRTENEIEDFKATLEPKLQKWVEYYGLTDTSHPLYRMIKHKVYDVPLARFLREDANDYVTGSQQTVARYLARGGKTGVYKMDQYLDLVKSREILSLVGKGVKNGGVERSAPIMAMLSPEQKALINWNTHPEAQKTWQAWAETNWAITKQLKEAKKTATSKEGKAIWDWFYNDYTQELMANDPDFALEYQFSQTKLHERLSWLGVGSGKDEESKGWAEFLGIITDYYDELGSMWNKTTKKYGFTPQSQTAGQVSEKYLIAVGKLAKRNKRWWEIARKAFPLSKFGLVWKSPTPYDDYLWGLEAEEEEAY